jgi:type I restriction enzyme S subunit
MNNHLEWPTFKLGDIATSIRNGLFAKRPTDDPSGTRILRISAVRNGVLDLGESRFVEGLSQDLVRQFSIKENDILVTRYNGTRRLVGVSAIVPDHLGPILHPDKLIRIVLDHRRADSMFVNYQLQSPGVRQFLEPRIRTTAGQSGISGRDVRDIPIVLPELGKQKEIVEFLSDHLSRLESALGTCSTTTQRLTRLRQAELNAKFGLNDKDSVALSDLLSGIQAGRSLGGSAPPAGENEWGIVKVSAMTWGEFRPEENKAIPESLANPDFEIASGDLLVSRANTSEYVGAPVLVGEVRRRLLLSDKSLRLVPRNDVDPEWLWRALQAPSARRQISAAATGTKDSMRNISQKLLMGIRLPRVEPDVQRWLAKAYAERDSELKRIERAAKAGILRIEALRRAVLNAAYSGALNDKIEELAGV